MFQALADRDTVSLKYNCTDDIIIYESGEIFTLDTLVQGVRRNLSADFKRINKFEFLDTKVNGEIAWTSYYNQADITRNGKNRTLKWLETAILIKEKGRWRIKVLHSTALKS